MSKIKFHKEEDSKADKLYLVVYYEGGDADTSHPEEIEYEGHTYSNWEAASAQINEDLKRYKKLKKALDVNDKDYCEDDYEQVKEKFGQEIADLYDNAPNDPQSDYSRKCYIDRVYLMGYDQKGNKYETYDLL